MTALTPPFRWVGGKRKIAPMIVDRLPRRVGTYYEPFLGGGAVMLQVLAEGRAESVVATDANPFLIAAWKAIALRTEGLLRKLEVRRRHHSQEYFLEVRDRLNAATAHGINEAADFLYLQGASFNGLWRVNSRGGYNTPWGDRKPESLFRPEVIRAAATLVRKVAFECRPWADSVARAQAGDAVYLDPPFLLHNPADFDAYTAGGFGEEQHRLMAAAAIEARDRGAHIIASNADLPLSRQLWAAFEVETVRVAYSVAAAGDRRGPTAEILARGAIAAAPHGR